MTAQSIPNFASLQQDAASKKAARDLAFDAFEKDPTDAKGEAAVDAHNDFEQSSLAFILGLGVSAPKK